MKAKEMREMNVQQLNEKLEEMQKELVKLNAQVATGTNPKNPSQIKNIKKNIARILTLINEKERIIA